MTTASTKIDYTCVSCGFVMYGIWHTKCKVCHEPCCHECVWQDDQYWYCPDCAPKGAAKHKPSTSISQVFNSLVDSAIALNIDMRTKLRLAPKTLSPANFAAEFCTVHVNVGRGSGKSSYILNRSQPGDSIVVPDTNMLKEFRLWDIGGKLGKTDRHVHIAAASTMMSAPKFAAKHSTIWVDEPRHVERYVTLDRLYRELAIGYEHTFILLGR